MFCIQSLNHELDQVIGQNETLKRDNVILLQRWLERSNDLCGQNEQRELVL